MDEEVPAIRIPTEAFMEEATVQRVGLRRDEDIALDLMKFVAITTGYGRTASASVGFQGGGGASKPEEYATHLLELYGKCLYAVRNQK
jgi:xanthine dehydrogenase iron-sulfur cluster and FAD-binding subunit A